MSDAIREKVVAKLQEIGGGSAIAFELDVDKYFDVMSALLEEFALTKKLNCIYITASIPSTTLINAFGALGIDISRIQFVDCVSKSIFGNAPPLENVSYLDSPTMLENVILKVEYLLKKYQGKEAVIFIDSVSALAVYNDTGMLTEFFQILLNSLRSKGNYAIMIAIANQIKPDVREMLALVSDEVVNLS
ncbi:MAG: hypothetical protein H5T41_06305 [Methanomassiliicoccales archaeon]|nr:hypothetical protein [Methanomassiliicoccales archaeon]